MKYRPEIDGLRALAVLPVILFHAGYELFSGGYVGVDVFFVISGYLITTIIIADLDKGKFSLVDFYKRRARRILPALYFVMLVCLPLAWMWFLPRHFKDFAQSLVAVSTFSSNIFFWHESGYFAAAAEQKPLLHTWSLAVEEQYYILFPLAIAALWKYGYRTAFTVMAGVLIVSLTAAQLTVDTNPGAAFYLLTTRCWELLVGVLVAIYLHRHDVKMPLAMKEIGASLGLALIIFAVFVFDKNTPFPGVYALLPTVGTGLIILLASQKTLISRLLGARPLVGIGLISYSAYLWHQPLLAFAKYRSPWEPPALLIAMICILTFPIAYLSWKFVEQPFRSVGKVPTKKFVIGSLVMGTAFLTLGVAGHYSQGFEKLHVKRYDGNTSDVAIQFSSAFLHVSRRWKQELELRSFAEAAAKTKVLIIGDSYGMDVANAVYTSKLAESYYLSAYHISRICGNVWTDDDLAQHIAQSDLAKCNRHLRYSDPRLTPLIKTADEIWLVSSWQNWHVPYIHETLTRLSAITSARLKVFGRKNFGTHVSFYNFMEVTNSGKRPYEVKLTEDHIDTNDKMKSTIEDEIFIDVSDILCGDRTKCINNTDDGLIISHDGNHLTQEGAQFLGEKLEGILTH